MRALAILLIFGAVACSLAWPLDLKSWFASYYQAKEDTNAVAEATKELNMGDRDHGSGDEHGHANEHANEHAHESHGHAHESHGHANETHGHANESPRSGYANAEFPNEVDVNERGSGSGDDHTHKPKHEHGSHGQGHNKP